MERYPAGPIPIKKEILMAIKSKEKRKLEIDLCGPQGNAYFLMGAVTEYGRQLGMSKQKMNDIIAEMKSGDYENLIKVFDKNFGDYIDLVR
jgi:hypothetical protein